MPEDDAALIAIYDGECGLCRGVAGWLRRHDRRQRLRFEPIADVVDVGGQRLHRAVLETEMHVVARSGRVYRGFRSWRRIAREVPILWPLLPLLWLPGAGLVGDRAYRWVAGHRTIVSRRLGLEHRMGSCEIDADGQAGCGSR